MDRKFKLAIVAAAAALTLGTGEVLRGGLSDAPGAAVSQVSLRSLDQSVMPGQNRQATHKANPSKVAPGWARSVETTGEAAVASTGGIRGAFVHAGPSDQLRPRDARTCPVTFEATAVSNGMIDVALMAPCRSGQRVILRHGGLVVAFQASRTGALATTLPGLDREGEVVALFADGRSTIARAPLSDLGGIHRFGVQWVAPDMFSLNAFENGAGFGDAGHVSADNPHRTESGSDRSGGYLLMVGDKDADPPMLAEIYTFPAAPAVKAVLDLEATVTQSTCDRELLGEIVQSYGGRATISDLTLAMPDCAAMGDVLVLDP